MSQSKSRSNIATKPHSAPTSSPSTRRIVLLVFLAVGLLQSAVLVGVAVVGHRAFVRLDAKLQQLEPYSVFTEAHAPQEVVEKVGDVLRAVVGDFVLGASNGQIANFVSNLLQKDLGGISKDVYLWAQQVEQGMLNTSCSRWIAECPAWQMPADRSFYWGQPYANISCGTQASLETCYYYGDDYWYPVNFDLQCDTTWCAGENFRDVSRYTEAVADKLMEIPLLSAPSGPAAFSNGLFQVDGLFQWIDTQTGLGGWKAAGLSCLSLVAKARPIAWDGCFTDTVDQSTQCWNVTSSVRQVLDYATQICQGLANVPWQ